KDPTPPPEEASPEQKAANLRDVVPAAYLYGAATGLFKENIDVASCQAYLRTLLQDAGDPADPIVRMLIEQLAMAHHTLGRLHFRAATREGLAEIVAYHSALARLMSEFRKSSLALQSLRQSADGAQVNPPKKPVQGPPPRSADPVQATAG